jgi:hypothetical protein
VISLTQLFLAEAFGGQLFLAVGTRLIRCILFPRPLPPVVAFSSDGRHLLCVTVRIIITVRQFECGSFMFTPGRGLVRSRSRLSASFRDPGDRKPTVLFLFDFSCGRLDREHSSESYVCFFQACTASVTSRPYERATDFLLEEEGVSRLARKSPHLSDLPQFTISSFERRIRYRLESSK